MAPVVRPTPDVVSDTVNARVVAPRRSLPSGRAVTGGFLVAFAAIGTFAAYRGAAAGPSHQYVVAAHPIAAGTILDASDLGTATVDLPAGLADRAFPRAASVEGRVSLAPLAAGELVQSSAVAEASKADARYEITLSLDRANALGGAIEAGELLDVSCTYGEGTDAVTIVVARRAEVVRITDAKRGALGGSAEL